MTVLKIGSTIKNFISGINANFSELSGKLTHSPVSVKLLYSGSVEIPARDEIETATITLNSDVTAFDGLIFVREDCDASIIIRTPSVGTIFKPVSQQADYTQMFEGLNLFMCNAQVTTTTQLSLSGNCYSGVGTSGSSKYYEWFGDRPLEKVYGLKFN